MSVQCADRNHVVVIHGLITVSAPSPIPIYLRSQLPIEFLFSFLYFFGGGGGQSIEIHDLLIIFVNY